MRSPEPGPTARNRDAAAAASSALLADFSLERGARYRIRVRGRLSETIRSAFPALRARADGGDTVLTGVLADQAALYGVLAEAEALGLELIEVRRLPPDEPRGVTVMTARPTQPGRGRHPHRRLLAPQLPDSVRAGRHRRRR